MQTETKRDDLRPWHRPGDRPVVRSLRLYGALAGRGSLTFRLPADEVYACGGEPLGYGFVLALGDAWPVADDQVALPNGPLVPALVRDVEAVSKCTGNGFRPGPGEHRAVNGDW